MFYIFKNYSQIVAEISKKSDGNMRISEINDEIIENRRRFFTSSSGDSKNFILAGLTHGNAVKNVGKADAGKIIPETDGLITADKNIFLSVTVADCLPVYFFDPKKEAVGIAHAGWKGLAKNILAKAVEKFKLEFKSDPKNILVGMGPGICAIHYDVSADRALEFDRYRNGAVLKKDGKFFLDLKNIARMQVEKCGILSENIEIDPSCTFEEKNSYFSYRRDKPREIEAMVATIGIFPK